MKKTEQMKTKWSENNDLRQTDAGWTELKWNQVIKWWNGKNKLKLKQNVKDKR